ncbi:max-like protein X [Oscarella lobularis]|uniref:max-like protein X n=1 Tax=Oscarella lobularis TaxID=121494 RepID=UPI00331370A6
MDPYAVAETQEDQIGAAKFVLGSPQFLQSAGGAAASAAAAPSASYGDIDANDDDDEEEGAGPTRNRKTARRMAHTVAEQRRRDQIKKGYDELQRVVPTCNEQGLAAQKVSKALVLHKAIEYISFLQHQNSTIEDELERLRKEVTALQIMKENYEQIAQAHKSSSFHSQNQISSETKFDLFRQIMDTHFQTFNAAVSVSNFEALSASVFSWLEEYCQPTVTREIAIAVLRSINQQLS